MGNFVFVLTLAIALAACTAAGGGAPGPDGGSGGKTDDISGGDCEPLTCQPDWCLKRSDGCGGVLDCGECSPGDDPGDDPVDDDPPDDDPPDDDPPVGTCTDSGETDSASSPRHFGEFAEDNGGGDSEEEITEIWTGEKAALTGSDNDYYSMGLDDTIDDGNPVGGFGVNASDTTTDLTLVLTVECNDPDATAEVSSCLYDGTLSGNSCVLHIPAGSSAREVDVVWNCTKGWLGTNVEDATLTAQIMADCDGSACDACQVYEVGARINDQDD